MIRIRTLTTQEESDLQSLIRSNNTIIHRRARIILISAQSKGVPEIAETVGLCEATIRETIKRFNSQGTSSLVPGKSSGRPRKFNQACSDKLVELLRKKPEEFGIKSGVWTLDEAAKVAKDQGIVDSICIEGLRQVLLREGLSWKRVKGFITPSDPNYEQKKKLRDYAIKTALSNEEYDLEFTDESWFVAQEPDGIMNPQMGSAWSESGETLTVPLSRKKGKTTVSVYAGLSIKSGQINYRFTHKNNTDETIEYLKMRSEQCMLQGLKRLYIVWDNASFHISKKLKSWLKEHNRNARKCGSTQIHFVPLPSKSPWLNPIEAVFRWIKRRALLCQIHRTLEILKQTVADCIAWRNNLSPACNVKT